MRLIVTRPEPDATRTAQALIRLGHEAILSPMLDIVPDPRAPIPDLPFQAVLMTSSNAVRALSVRSALPFARDVPMLTVGDQTALAARRAGFTGARSADGSVEDLLALASKTLLPIDGPILYTVGEDRSGDLAGALSALGFVVEAVAVYRAEPRARLADVAEAALREREVDGILLYSRRSAEAFAKALEAAALAPLEDDVTCFCLSPAIAEIAAPIAKGRVLTPERPEQIALFAMIEREAATSG
jgi:uroporphyrinogen-III synthase